MTQSTPSASAVRQPLPIPAEFDPVAQLLARTVDGQIFHTPLHSVRFCERLLANGTPADVALAEQMIPGILSAQVLDPTHPHYGAFKWELEMEAVEDLNSVQFILYALIPILLQHGDLLRPSLKLRMRDSVAAGLENVQRIDVSLEYTNIALKDITNTCLGGELLNDRAFLERGRSKLNRWIEYTDRSGGPCEFNSVPYTGIAMKVLSTLRRFARDPEIKVRAHIALARLTVSAGLHLHGGTRRWAGPQSRAYHGTVVGRGAAYLMDEQEAETFERWIKEGIIPDWAEALVRQQDEPEEVLETVDRQHGIQSSTYLTPQYALGVSSRNAKSQKNRFIAWQSKVFALHYTRPGLSDTGSIYTRYLLDDNWLGHFSPGAGRPLDGLLPDVGNFQGIQDRERAIGLYAPQDLGALEPHSGAKAVIAIPRWSDAHDEAWAGQRRITKFPQTIEPGVTIIIATGSIMLAVKPFKLTNLGTSDQVFLRRVDDTLLIELVNYRGPAKTFWELAWPGAFYQGLPRCGFYSEVAPRRAHPNGAEFAAVIDRGILRDDAAPPLTYTGEERRPWRVSYNRDGRELGIEVDLMDWFRSALRWTHRGPTAWPMLDSTHAKQTTAGEVTVGDCTFKSSKELPIWLFVSPKRDVVVAAYHGVATASVELTTPFGNVKIKKVDACIITLTKDKCSVDSIGIAEEPMVSRPFSKTATD